VGVGDGEAAVGGGGDARLPLRPTAGGDGDGPGQAAAGLEHLGVDVGVAAAELEGVADHEVAVAGHRDAGVELRLVVGGDAEGAAQSCAIRPIAGGPQVAVAGVEVPGPDDDEVAAGVHRHDGVVVDLAAALDGDLLADLAAGRVVGLRLDVGVPGRL